MPLKIKDYKAGDGSRFSLLIDTETSLPMYHPTAFISISLSSLAPNTRRANLYAIKRVYDWADKRGIDLEHRFSTKTLLALQEVESLVQALSVNTKETDGSTIRGAKVNYHLQIVSKYFGWLFGIYITDSNADENRKLIERLQENLMARMRKRGSAARDKRRRIAKKLSPEADTALLGMFAAFQPPNDEELSSQPTHIPAGNAHHAETDAEQSDAEEAGQSLTEFQYGVAYRNVLALRLLYDLGMRLGELLGLRYCDFIPSSGGETAYIRIERNHDDAYDRRMNQPVAKTLGRTLPISLELERMMLVYLGKYRADIPNVGYDDHSFILVNHKAGKNQGREIEISTFRSALAVIIKREPQLKKLHPHLLRHHWNYRFSEQATKEVWTDVKTRQMREHWMGWVEGSSSAKDYDLRHIQESANKHGRAIASDTARNKADRRRKNQNSGPQSSGSAE